MTEQPNILFITVDQWPGYLLGCEGHRSIDTPTLDHLTRLGTRFTNCYSETPICIPARRSIMTGLTARTHGDRTFQPVLAMPEGVPTLARCLTQAGWQSTAIGKLHVYPQRDRIGFDDAHLAEEGRGHMGGPDDYEMFLADRGAVGAQFLHGMSNNDYGWTSWHLDDSLHVTNWTTVTAARQIKRKDPTRPAFWHVSYTHPHPPLVPLKNYLDRYRDVEMPTPITGEWSENKAALPYALRAIQSNYAQLNPRQLAAVRRAFYALCTHIDHQIRLLIGTLREEMLLDNTIIVFTSDHGDMLGDHGLFGKRVLFDASARVPLIIVDRAQGARTLPGKTDDRLIALHDLMPTMLEMVGVKIPDHCEGISAVAQTRRKILYGEALEGPMAMRMVRDDQYKLIWYLAGNHIQLFDLIFDPEEQYDLSQLAEYEAVRRRLTNSLRERLYGSDLNAVSGEKLTGLPIPELPVFANRGLSGQRGVHYPGPRIGGQDQPVGAIRP